MQRKTETKIFKIEIFKTVCIFLLKVKTDFKQKNIQL